MRQRVAHRLLIVCISLGALVSCSNKSGTPSATGGGPNARATAPGSIPAPAPSSPPLGPMDEAQAASRGLKTMIARAKLRPTQYGFADPAEAERATLGTHYSIEQVGATALKQWAAAPQPLPPPFLTTAERRLYLVNVGNQARAIIIVAKTPQGWAPTELGNEPVATNIANAVTKWPSATPHSLVYIPALHLYLLKTTGPGPAPARFAPVQDIGTHKQGVEVPPQTLFQTLYSRLPAGTADSGDPSARPPF
jgi:hypothetical protein